MWTNCPIAKVCSAVIYTLTEKVLGTNEKLKKERKDKWSEIEPDRGTILIVFFNSAIDSTLNLKYWLHRYQWQRTNGTARLIVCHQRALQKDKQWVKNSLKNPNHKSFNWRWSVWPDVKIKSGPIFTKVAKNSSHSSFYQKGHSN